MKKIITRLLLLAVLLGMSLNDVATAQHYSRPYHRQRYRSNHVLEALDAAEHVGRAAMFGMFLHGLDDYTGFRVGYNAASLRTSLRHSNFDSNFTPGLNVGFVFGWHLGRTPLIIEPGLYYSMKGGEIKGTYNDRVLDAIGSYTGKDYSRFTNKVTMHNFEVPLVLKCQLPLSPDNYVAFQPFFGGFVSFGFGGDTKIDDFDGRDKYGTYSDDLFCTTDAGLRMGVGLNVGMFYLECAYDLGLVNLPQNGYGLMHFDDFDDSMRSNTISFSVGVNF